MDKGKRPPTISVTGSRIKLPSSPFEIGNVSSNPPGPVEPKENCRKSEPKIPARSAAGVSISLNLKTTSLLNIALVSQVTAGTNADNYCAYVIDWDEYDTEKEEWKIDTIYPYINEGGELKTNGDYTNPHTHTYTFVDYNISDQRGSNNGSIRVVYIYSLPGIRYDGDHGSGLSAHYSMSLLTLGSVIAGKPDGNAVAYDSTSVIQLGGKRPNVTYSEPSIDTLLDNAFSGCTRLTLEYNFGNPKIAIKNIGSNAFRNCTRITYLGIGNVETIGNSAFNSCTNLSSTSYKFFEKVTSIGDEAFANCINLSEALLSHNNHVIDSIGSYAFDGCFRLKGSKYTNMDLVVRANSIGEYAFSRCSSLMNVKIYNASELNNNTFELSGVHKVTLDDSITIIGKECFSDCNNLGEINLGNVWKIGDYAFKNCGALYEVNLSSVISLCNNNLMVPEYKGEPCPHALGVGAFYECTNLTRCAVDGGKYDFTKCKFNYFPPRVFYNCSKLRRVTGYSDPEYMIDTEAFYQCKEISFTYSSDKDDVPTNALFVYGVGSKAFYGIKNAVVNPESVVTADTRCSNIFDVRAAVNLFIPKEFFNVELKGIIGPDAFSGCFMLNKIKFITITDGMISVIKSVGSKAFNGCTNLTTKGIEAWDASVVADPLEITVDAFDNTNVDEDVLGSKYNISYVEVSE